MMSGWGGLLKSAIASIRASTQPAVRRFVPSSDCNRKMRIPSCSPALNQDPDKRRNLQSDSLDLRPLHVDPLRQSAPILFQQEGSRAKAFAKNTMRLRIAGGAGNPLLANLILGSRKPPLRKNLHQPCLQIKYKKCERGIVIRYSLITGRHDEFIDRLHFSRHVDLVHSRRQR